ncbi:MAG: heme exporter protein CcmD [Hyphomicrobiaceae bacterium]
MDLGPHAVFIWTSYVVVALGVSSLIGWLLIQGRRFREELKALDARGVRRRGGAEPGAGTAAGSG